MAEITSTSVANNTLQTYWGTGVSGYTYTLDGAKVDLQDLLVDISKNRASAVEDEINPLSTRIRNRNEKLDSLGTVLSELTEIQATFDSDADGDDKYSGSLSADTVAALKELGYNVSTTANTVTKSQLEGMVQQVKSSIDGLNNEAQTDMTRLQSLVDRRDEAYSTATSLLTDISDTRSNLIKNL